MTGRALLTDFYELTMAASYFTEGMNYRSTFELFTRELPGRRNFLIACGLDLALEYLEGLEFSREDIDYLHRLGLFQDDFLDYLGELRFSGEVWAIPEGEVFFPPEPVLRVTAPLIEAQVVETYLLNCLDFQSLVASKAARIAIACRGRPFVDFSARRDHGPDAAVLAGRASFVGGAAATSNVQAASQFGIPPSGTMAHSYVMTVGDEERAFKMFARQFGEQTVLLIDTFDTLEGARKAAAVAAELAGEGIRIRGVRLDSGDIGSLAGQVRRVLDEAGYPGLEILVSGDLDEYRIDALLSAGAPIDGFGVGTQLGTGGDVPSLGGAYKLVEDAEGPKLKLSPGKATLPGAKQVYRRSRDGTHLEDVIALASEPVPERGPGTLQPLIEPVMSEGRRLGAAPALEELKQRCRAALAALPERLLSLEGAEPYPVSFSQGLQQLRASMSERLVSEP